MKKILLVALATVGLTGSAFAQASLGTLVVGFRDDGSIDSTGASNSLTINVGLKSSLAGGPAVDLGNYASVLSSTFGANWATDTGLLWGVAGSTGIVPSTQKEAFMSKATSGSLLDGVTPSSTAWNVPASSNSINNKVVTMYNTASNTVGASVVTPNSNSQAWASPTVENGATAWGVFQKNLYEQAGAGQADLYDLNLRTSAGQPGTFLGTFNLQSNGELFFFGTSAIPEPSTYAALLGVVTLGIVAIRRRRQASIEV